MSIAAPMFQPQYQAGQGGKGFGGRGCAGEGGPRPDGSMSLIVSRRIQSARRRNVLGVTLRRRSSVLVSVPDAMSVSGNSVLIDMLKVAQRAEKPEIVLRTSSLRTHLACPSQHLAIP
jgi:hypothetical protein